jgi:hypothetical protein
MRKAVRLVIVCAFILMPAVLIAREKFDGNWMTTLTCPPKGDTEGYTWKFPAVIKDGAYHGERGTAGQPGYFSIDGKIADDGTAKLSANGIIASRKYARGVFAHKGEEYNYDVKAQFKETEGTGTKSQGLGIVGRTCTFEFVKQQAVSQTGGR